MVKAALLCCVNVTKQSKILYSPKYQALKTSDVNET